MHINKYFVYQVFSTFSTIIGIQNYWQVNKIIKNNQKEVFYKKILYRLEIKQPDDRKLLEQ